MKKIFATFADSKFSSSRRRITREAKSFKFFDRIYSLDETYFDKEFKAFFKEGDKKNQRGYGYWCWKPYCIRRILKDMQYGDALLYCDAGCHLNIAGKPRLVQYFELLESNDIIAFDQDTIEEQYTKEDLFRYFKIEIDNSAIRKSRQVLGGIFFIRKTEQIEQLVEQWYEVCRYHYNLITDSPSTSANSTSFIEHRHDQSVFSILAKMNGFSHLNIDETYARNGDWASMSQYPIWAVRDKTMNLFQRLKIRLTKILSANEFQKR